MQIKLRRRADGGGDARATKLMCVDELTKGNVPDILTVLQAVLGEHAGPGTYDLIIRFTIQ